MANSIIVPVKKKGATKQQLETIVNIIIRGEFKLQGVIPFKIDASLLNQVVISHDDDAILEHLEKCFSERRFEKWSKETADFARTSHAKATNIYKLNL